MVLGLGKHFAYGTQHTKALVADHQLDSAQTTATEPLKEANLADLALFHASAAPRISWYPSSLTAMATRMVRSRTLHPSCGADRFRLRKHTGNARPARASSANPQCGHTPSCSVHGWWRERPCCPTGLCNVLYVPNGYACQVHLNESFLYAAFPAAVSLNDSDLKGAPFEFGHLEGDISGRCGEIAAVMTAAIAPGAARCARTGPHGSASPLRPPAVR